MFTNWLFLPSIVGLITIIFFVKRKFTLYAKLAVRNSKNSNFVVLGIWSRALSTRAYTSTDTKCWVCCGPSKCLIYWSPCGLIKSVNEVFARKWIFISQSGCYINRGFLFFVLWFYVRLWILRTAEALWEYWKY